MSDFAKLTEGLVVRPMIASDVSQISVIEQKVTPHPWRETQFVDSVEKHHCLVLILDEQIIGYAIYQVIVGEAEILNIAVDSACQSKGYGRYLLQYVIDLVSTQAERLYLEVRESNQPAIQLYESVGFAEICLRRNYYQTAEGPEDAIMMAMEL